MSDVEVAVNVAILQLGEGGRERCIWAWTAHRCVHARLPKQAQHQGDALSRTLDVRLELGEPMVLDAFCEPPAKVRHNSGLRVLARFTIRSTLQHGRLADLHNLDMIQVPSGTPQRFTERVDLALLDDPALRPRQNSGWEPARKGASFEDETSCAECAGGRPGSVYDVAGEYVSGVRVWIPEEEG